MSSNLRIAGYTRRFGPLSARMLPTAFALIGTALSVPLYGQSTWGASPTWVPAPTKVGIGTATPRAELDIVNAAWGLIVQGDYASVYMAPKSSTVHTGLYGMYYNASDINSLPSITNYTRVFMGFNEFIGDRTSAMIGTDNGGTGVPKALTFIMGGAEYMRISTAGNIGIGTTNPQSKLAVNGTITTREVVVSNTGWSDYVFRPDYQLRPLNEVAAYVKEHHHLPEIPSEAEVKEKGVGVGEMQSKLLAKIEELTLHMIHADERNDRLEQQNRELQERIARLEKPAATGAVK